MLMQMNSLRVVFLLAAASCTTGFAPNHVKSNLQRRIISSDVVQKSTLGFRDNGSAAKTFSSTIMSQSSFGVTEVSEGSVSSKSSGSGTSSSTSIASSSSANSMEEMQASGRRQVGKVLYKMNSSTKWVVTFAQNLAVWSRPWAYQGPFIVVGSILSLYLTEHCLKQWINQGRPEGAPLLDPGMPSCHAMVSFFSAVAWVTAILGSAPAIVPVLLMGSASTIAFLRVICGYHSIPQIGVGAILGSLLGWMWVVLGSKIHALDPKFAWVMSWSMYLYGAAFFIKGKVSKWESHE